MFSRKCLWGILCFFFVCWGACTEPLPATEEVSAESQEEGGAREKVLPEEERAPEGTKEAGSDDVPEPHSEPVLESPSEEHTPEIAPEGGEEPPEGSLRLVQGDQSAFRIVLHTTASPSEKKAAEELQIHLEKVSGAKLPIVEGEPAQAGPMIVLGQGPLAQKLGVNPDKKALGEQGFVLRTVPPHLVIAGTPEVGTLYGVYRFLEEQVGLRWIAPKVTLAPLKKTIVVAPLNRVVQPAFALRQTSYNWPGKDDAFLARVGFNVGKGKADHPYGLQYATWGRVHTFFHFVPPQSYFTTHPEYFSEIGGARRKHDTQLCLTNPDLLKVVLPKMLDLMKNNPETRHVGFSQQDYYSYCECSKCQAMYKKYSTRGATLFSFLSELAQETSKLYPDKLVSTLAYSTQRSPPRG